MKMYSPKSIIFPESNAPDTIEMLDRRLLPENQIQSVEENIYFELNIIIFSCNQ
jgi:hypothetical protein